MDPRLGFLNQSYIKQRFISIKQKWGKETTNSSKLGLRVWFFKPRTTCQVCCLLTEPNYRRVEKSLYVPVYPPSLPLGVIMWLPNPYWFLCEAAHPIYASPVVRNICPSPHINWSKFFRSKENVKTISMRQILEIFEKTCHLAPEPYVSHPKYTKFLHIKWFLVPAYKIVPHIKWFLDFSSFWLFTLEWVPLYFFHSVAPECWLQVSCLQHVV